VLLDLISVSNNADNYLSLTIVDCQRLVYVIFQLGMLATLS
jgi:hypothetical protein